MSFLPIVGRELVVAARRPGTHRVRFWSALIVLGVWLLVSSASRYVAPGQMGMHLLNALGVLALAFSLFAGVFRTADCLSEEKREGTLGLLFLTDLRAYDVVLGKLVAGSLDTFFGLLAIFPILGLTLLLGGVTGGEFGRLALVFVTTLFFSMGLGMFASAVSHDTRQAVTRGILLLLIFTGIFPLAWGVVSWGLDHPAPDWLLLPSPVYAYAKAFESNYRVWTGATAYWHAVGTVFALGLTGIVAANFILPRSWQQTGSEKPQGLRAKTRRPVYAQANAALRAGLLNFNPVYWLGVRDPGSGRSARVLMWVLAPLWFALWLSAFSGERFNGVPLGICVYTSFILHQVVKLLVAAEATRRMNQDRQSGALELLLVTPVPVAAIVDGQMKALRRNFRGPLVLLGLMNLGLWLALASQMSHGMGREGDLLTEILFGGVLMLVLDFNALCWVGLWRGLTSVRHARAVAGTYLRVMGIPWLSIFLIIFLRPFSGSSGSVSFVITVWFGIGAVVDFTTAATAKQKLYREFRRAAAGRYGNKSE